MALVADIVEVEAPPAAAAGGTVIVDVHVKNLGLAPGSYNYIAVTGMDDSVNLSWQFDYLYLAPQETVVFRGWFTMPPGNVTITVRSWYWDGSKWQVEGAGDDSAVVNIALTEMAETFSEFEITDYRQV